MLDLSAPIGKTAVEHCLHAFPKILRHKRCVDIGVRPPVPIEVSCVESISKFVLIPNTYPELFP
jgi:hypothetical protein